MTRAPKNAARLILNLPARGILTEQEIKKAYLRCSLQLHPDKNDASSADAAFKRVGWAYETLLALAEPLPGYWVSMFMEKDGSILYFNVVTKDATSSKP